MTRPSFTKVKENYKLSGTDKCTMNFPNTCAIRLSEALVAASPNLIEVFKNSGKNVCPHGYVRGAQDLAAILKQTWGNRDLGWSALSAAPKDIIGKYGVICYMNTPAAPCLSDESKTIFLNTFAYLSDPRPI